MRAQKGGETVSTPREQYDAMLDELDADSKAEAEDREFTTSDEP